MGPGRYRATRAVRSSTLRGFAWVSSRFIPADSNWNTPTECPCPSIWNTAGSSCWTFSTSNPGSRRAASFWAWSITDKFLRPRKSIFKSPSSSMAVMVYWVTTTSSFLARGT